VDYRTSVPYAGPSNAALETARTHFMAGGFWIDQPSEPAMLPSAWGGRIPPLTSIDRHKKIDPYVKRQVKLTGNGKPVFVDLWCDFPPLTTVDTAGNLPDWSVFGVDRAFSSYVLYNADRAYACFSREGRFQYLQSP
jgi:hypothetical protein